MPKNKVQFQKGLSLTAFNSTYGTEEKCREKLFKGTYHSVSSRHLPRYLAEFSFRFNNRFYMAAMVGALIRHAAVTSPIPQRFLKLAEE